LTERTSWVRSPFWAAAAVAEALVGLLTLSIAPRLWLSTILPLLQPHVTRWYVGLGTAILAGLLVWAWRAGPMNRGRAFLVLAALMGVYLVLLYVVYAGEAPAKKWHVVQYGIMGGLAFQAVRVDSRERRGILVAALFLFVIGTVDEVSQKFIPMRTFRWLDLAANHVGSCLGAIGWFASSPHSPWRKGP
jgi:FtsH-binding integral membrane protein